MLICMTHLMNVANFVTDLKYLNITILDSLWEYTSVIQWGVIKDSSFVN